MFGSENYSSHNSLAWLLGFGSNHSLLLFVQYCHHHIETRQIQYNSQVYRTLVELVHKKLESSLELHNRSSPGVEAHHSVSGLNAGRNSGGRRIKKPNIIKGLLFSFSFNSKFLFRLQSFKRYPTFSIIFLNGGMF